MAEENTNINVNENQDPGNENEDMEQDTPALTKEDIQKMMESYADKRVAQALKTQQRKFE